MYQFVLVLQLLLAMCAVAPSRAQQCDSQIEAFAVCMRQKLVKSKGSIIDAKMDYKREISFRTDETTFDDAWDLCTKSTDYVSVPVPSADFDGWAVGMKLEALDRLNPSMIAVATVTDVDGNNVSITFDGWSDGFDYTTDKSSDDLHPIGYAMYIKHAQNMYKPNNYPGKFNWKKYLVETDSVPVAYESFNMDQTNGMPKEFYVKMITTDIIQPGS